MLVHDGEHMHFWCHPGIMCSHGSHERFHESLYHFRISDLRFDRKRQLQLDEAMAPGGVETSVFHNKVFPESAQFDFSFDTPGIRIFKLILSFNNNK